MNENVAKHSSDDLKHVSREKLLYSEQFQYMITKVQCYRYSVRVILSFLCGHFSVETDRKHVTTWGCFVL